MYGAMWRRLPGPWPVKLLESAAMVVGVTALLFIVVFPWLEPRLPFTDVTVDDEAGADIVDQDNPDPSVDDPASSTPDTDPQNPTLGRQATALLALAVVR